MSDVVLPLLFGWPYFVKLFDKSHGLVIDENGITMEYFLKKHGAAIIFQIRCWIVICTGYNQR